MLDGDLLRQAGQQFIIGGCIPAGSWSPRCSSAGGSSALSRPAAPAGTVPVWIRVSAGRTPIPVTPSTDGEVFDFGTHANDFLVRREESLAAETSSSGCLAAEPSRSTYTPTSS
jgi:hypothetical protein